MGTFSVLIQIGDLRGDHYEGAEALVDTGASHSLIARDVLAALGIEAIERVAFELADERVVEYEVGEARIRIDGRERATLVVFGPAGSGALLGATTLQLFNLAVDTVQERLVPVRGLLKRLSLEVKNLTARLEAREAV
jgi:clan AA aspartic protease